MTDPDDQDGPLLSMAQDGGPVPHASIDAITTLIHSFASMISAMEKRITDRIAENATLSKERWGRWEADFRAYRETTDHRIGMIEDRLDSHLTREREEDLVAEARVKPVRTMAGLILHNWRTILLAILAVLGLLGFTSDVWRGIVGG